MKKTLQEFSTRKPYECTVCGDEKEFQTNHYGESYPWCSVCQKQTVWKCNAEMPDDFEAPENWKTVKISDIAGISEFMNNARYKKNA